MKKNRKIFRNFLSVLLIFVLCFTAAMTAFAEGEQPETESGSEQTTTAAAEEAPGSTDTPGASESGISGQNDSEKDGLTKTTGSGEVPADEEITDEPESDEEEIAGDETAEEDSSEMAEEDSSEEQSEENAEDSSEEESTPEEAVSEDGSGADMDAAVAEIVESIREEYGDEAAAGFEKMLGNPNMKAFIETLQRKLEAEFPGMSDEEISEKLDAMSDEETLALMEKIFNDPEIIELSEAVSEDEELAEQMEALMEILLGEEITADDDENLEEPVSGNQGDSISWTLDTNGTLTISGNGPIVPSYEEFAGMNLPFYEWDDYIDNITKVVIKDGVTDVPEDAFSYSSTLKTVVIPASVKSIGSEAFICCENLTTVYFQGDAPEIAEDAFDECSEDLTLYYREGTKGWDKVTGYRLAVWNAASSGESSEESKTTQTEKNEQSPSSMQETGKNVQETGKTAQETGKAAAAGSNNPYTGDSGSVWPFVLLMAAAVICGGVVIIRMRRKR